MPTPRLSLPDFSFPDTNCLLPLHQPIPEGLLFGHSFAESSEFASALPLDIVGDFWDIPPAVDMPLTSLNLARSLDTSVYVSEHVTAGALGMPNTAVFHNARIPGSASSTDTEPSPEGYDSQLILGAAKSNLHANTDSLHSFSQDPTPFLNDASPAPSLDSSTK